MITVIILSLISVALIVHVSIIAFKQKKRTDMIVELYEEFLIELEKEKQLDKEKKKKNERK